jgi:hypothetical protein
MLWAVTSESSLSDSSTDSQVQDDEKDDKELQSREPNVEGKARDEWLVCARTVH